jgi:hypothetical protein
MSLADSKNSIFTLINSYSSYMQQPAIKRTNLFESVNNKEDIVPFILDVLKSITGVEGMKEAVGDMFTKLVSSAETSIKTVLKKNMLQFNSGGNISNNLKNSGIDIPIKKMDTKGKLKIDPNSASGGLIYKTTKTDFDNIAYNAINAPNTIVSNNSMGIDLKYNDTLDTMNVKIQGTTNNIGQFFEKYIDNSELLNENEIVTNVMDNMFGTFSSQNNRTKNEVIEDLKVQKMLEKSTINNESITILPTELEEIDNLSNQIVSGVVTYNLGCAVLDVSLPFSGLTELINSISGTSNSFAVSNALDNTITSTTESSNEAAATKNKETIRDSFFQKLIKYFINVLLQAALTQPQIRVMVSLFDNMKGNVGNLSDSASEYITKMTQFIKCMVKELIELIVKFLFNLVVSKLVEFIRPIIEKRLKEKINQLKNTITSLTGFKAVSDVIG